MPTKGLPGRACSKIRRQLADLPTSCKVCYNYVDACVNCVRSRDRFIFRWSKKKGTLEGNEVSGTDGEKCLKGKVDRSSDSLFRLFPTFASIELDKYTEKRYEREMANE